MVRRSCCVMLLLMACSVFAAENASVLGLSPNLQRGDIYHPQGLWPLLGVGLGAMDHNSVARTGGLPSHIKVLGSYYFKAPWVVDLGVGLHSEFLTQKGTGSDSIQSLYTEFAGRYEFANRIQLGAIWNTLVDNPDRYHSNTSDLASFVGLQALKEFAWKDEYLVRAGGRAVTSLGLHGGTVNTVMAELEVSFGAGHAGDSAGVENGKPLPPTATITSKSLAPHLAAQAIRTFNTDPEFAHFDSNSTRLTPPSERYYKHLARALSENHELFDHVEVIGHTDQRGSFAYNDHLSRQRARAVANTLIAAGVRTSQVRTDGKGKRQLLTHSTRPLEMSRNRRVQLEFYGIKNQAALERIIQSISR